jgi:RHS repeat-associated protein
MCFIYDAKTKIKYAQDAFGNLQSVALPSGTQVQYLLDGLNRRIAKKFNGALIQRFLYQDQLRIAAELDENGQLKSRFVYGLKPNVPEYMIQGGAAYRIVTDQLGSPRVVVNAEDGSIVQQMNYDEWGNVTRDTNPGFQPFGFAGGLYDRDTKIVHFGAREYDAYTARWLQCDPIGLPGGLNLYTYVRNNPVNLIDPSGLLGFPGGSDAFFGGIAENFPTMVNTAADAGVAASAAGLAALAAVGTAPEVAVFAATNPAVFNQILPTVISNVIGGANNASLTPNGNTEPDLAALGLLVKQITKNACGN